MRFSPGKADVEAVLVLRGTTEFQKVLEAIARYRNDLLSITMEADDAVAHRCRHKAAVLSELLHTFESIEQVREELEQNG